MTSPKFARLAAHALEDGEKRFDDAQSVSASPAPPVRAAAIAAIEAAIRARSRARTIRRSSLGALAFAATAAIAFGAWHARAPHAPSAASNPSSGSESPSAQMSAATLAIAHPSGDGASLVASSLDPQTAPMVEGQRLAAGSRVVAKPGGRALLAFATGTQLTVEDGGDLTIEEGGESKTFALHAGVLRADAAGATSDERIVVRTSDAEVEGNGASFRLAIARPDASCGNGTSTRISVYGGRAIVRVNGVETLVDAGSDWPSSSCAASAEARDTRHPGDRDGTPKHAPRGPLAAATVTTSAATAATPATTISASTLAEQNDQFADALAAKRAGDPARAIARFDAFLAKYPTSPLAESAAAQRMKLLRDVDPPRANEAARNYLARYPNGFAKSDAAAIAGDR